MITASNGLRSTVDGSIYIESGAQGGGIVRYGSSYNRLEVWNGNSWVPFPTHHIDFDPAVEEVLHWSQKKMREERELERLLREHPELRELKEKYEMMRVLLTKADDDSRTR